MRIVIAIALLLLTACGGDGRRIGVEGVELQLLEGGEYPSAAELRVEVDNHGGAFTLRECRLRFGIEGRRQVVVSLEQSVRVGRGRQSVVLPLKVSVVRNSLTLKLKEMLSQGDVSQVEVDGELRVRRGWVSRRERIAATRLTELLSAAEVEHLCNIVKQQK